MRIRDVMTANVVTIPSDTTLADARRIMDLHRVKRLPVVDKGKLVGLVTREALDRAGPSQLTTFSIHEISYLLAKITVAQIMKKDVATISPDATVEEGVALAQQKRVGALPVLEDGKLVGITTTNDIFYKILNPTLGIGLPGSRVVVRDCGTPADICKAVGVVEKMGLPLVGVFTLKVPDTERIDCTLHLDVPDPEPVIAELSRVGLAAEKRAR